MTYSAIIVGAGHNGLVAANYLAKAGGRVLVLERRDFVGGACITEELFPDFRVSSCSYICHMLQGKVIDDLELRKHGLAIHPVNPYRFQPFPSGNYMLRWHDEAEQCRGTGATVSERRGRLWTLSGLHAKSCDHTAPLLPGESSDAGAGDRATCGVHATRPSGKAYADRVICATW